MMKAAAAVCIIMIALTGCLYDAPLTEEHNIPIDPSLLGRWEISVSDTNPSEPKDNIMILKFSDTEYLIHYIATADMRYYRGYPIIVGGVSCVQLQVIGTPEGVPSKDTKPFIPVSYQLIEGELEIKIVNNDLIDEDLIKGSGALRNAFLAHKDDPQLFRDPARFRRLE
jgi:hypothetical protein